MSNRTTTRRWRIYHVPEEAVLSLFIGRRTPECLYLPVPTNLPADAVVRDVKHCWENNTFGFRVESAEFDVVADGDMTPTAGLLEWESLKVMPDPGSADNPMRYDLLAAAMDETQHLRGIFGDLRNDSPAIKAAYEQGVQEEGERVLGHLSAAIGDWKKSNDSDKGIVIAALSMTASCITHRGITREEALSKLAPSARNR